jgi:hypothetical protein
MKTRIILILAFAMVFPIVSEAQQNQMQNRRVEREKLETAKIAFITNRLKLSADQAKDFWPLYNEYEAKKLEIRMRPVREGYRMTDGGKKDMTDADAKKILEMHIKSREEDLELERTYMSRFSDILQSTQVIRLISIDESFLRNYMMRSGPPDGQGGRTGGGPGRGTTDN